MVKLAVASTVALAACHSFQDPNVVVDLRVLAISAEPPDQRIDVDLTQPIDPIALLAQLVPTRVCALVADPPARRLAWRITMCAPTSDERCDDTDPLIGEGVLEDPETAEPAPALCATVPPDARVLAILAPAARDDVLHGLGGLDYQLTLRIGGETADRDLDLFAGKTLRVTPHLPAARTANSNPRLDRIDAAVADAAPVPLPLGRCGDFTPLTVPAGTKIRMTPVEAAGAREVYVVPTLDGTTQTFTETLRYQWIASDGGFSRGTSGGPHDVSGNPAPLFSDFTAPAKADIKAPTDISIWLIQRDERLGLRWYQSCVRVVP
jgi:hypothetical protein